MLRFLFAPGIYYFVKSKGLQLGLMFSFGVIVGVRYSLGSRDEVKNLVTKEITANHLSQEQVPKFLSS